MLYSAANNLQRIDGFGGDDIEKLAINELFEVLASLYWSKNRCC
jgi:hypothetical protein